ncbi:MAG: rRNA maturation RNase YbeY [Polyangiales bacterium]
MQAAIGSRWCGSTVTGDDDIVAAMVVVCTTRLSARDRGQARKLRRWAECMLRALRLSHCELSLLLCDDTRMQELNAQHRGKDRPTDVLAFPLPAQSPHPQLDAPLLGDIVIALPTARRQAATARIALDRELSMLLAHGLLHLLGCDHRDAQEDRRMRARVDALCAALPRGGRLHSGP